MFWSVVACYVASVVACYVASVVACYDGLSLPAMFWCAPFAVRLSLPEYAVYGVL